MQDTRRVINDLSQRLIAKVAHCPNRRLRCVRICKCWTRRRGENDRTGNPHLGKAPRRRDIKFCVTCLRGSSTHLRKPFREGNAY